MAVRRSCLQGRHQTPATKRKTAVRTTDCGFFCISIAIALFIVGAFITGSHASNCSSQRYFFSITYDPFFPRDTIALIIPGMNQTNSTPGYDSIGAFYKTMGILPVYIDVDWRSVGFKKLSRTAFQIDTMIQDSFPRSRMYLFGFSFGAVISLKLSQLLHAQKIILCSMSPLFKEDRAYQIFPFKQLSGFFLDFSSNGLSYAASKETCVYFLYGDHDNFLINKAIIQNRKSSFTCNETILIKNARHDISGRAYLTAISHLIHGIDK